MAPLKSLEREYPIIDSHFQRFCASHGISSVEDFLLHDLYVLVAYSEQQSSAERLKQGITQILSIIDGQHQPWLNGMELLEDAQRNKHVLSTGCEGIDLVLQGGIHEGHITELVGPSSSGKTQVCLHAASNVAKKYRGGVVYLDTCNSFSPMRIAHLVNHVLDPACKEVKDKVLKNVMSSIFFRPVFDIFAMLDVLHQLESNLTSQMQAGNGRVRLLIIDSISSLITPVLGGSGSHGKGVGEFDPGGLLGHTKEVPLGSNDRYKSWHALMISAGYVLKKLAYEYSLAVLVTNHMVGGEGGIPKPALGESWKSIPHARLRLSRDQGSNICNISILKHPCLASGKAARFVIYD